MVYFKFRSGLPRLSTRAMMVAIMLSSALLMAFAALTKVLPRMHIFSCLHFVDNVKIEPPGYSYIACGYANGWKRRELGFSDGELFLSWGDEPYIEIVKLGGSEDDDSMAIGGDDHEFFFSGWDKFGVRYWVKGFSSGKNTYLSATFPLFAALDTTAFLVALLLFRHTFNLGYAHKPRRAFEVITGKRGMKYGRTDVV